MNSRNNLLDVLKGGAIIAVIFYHLGVLPYGYLGVEIFLVVAGYLTTKGLVKLCDQQTNINKGGYWTFINTRLVRLWPLVLLVSAIALGGGWFWMMPLHYNLNCESVVGSSIFMNNFIQYITTGNYWTSDNSYKPLMHTWYVAIIFQFYALYPLVFIINKRFSKNWQFASFLTLVGLFVLSLVLYLSPLLTTAQNFYLLPSRLFEFAAGGMVAMYAKLKSTGKACDNLLLILAFAVVLLLMANFNIDAGKTRLLATVGIATAFVCMIESGYNLPAARWFKPLALAGTASYSLYLFHQVLFAFYRYAFNDVFSASTYVMMFTLALIVGFVVFFFLERPLSLFVRGSMKRAFLVNALCVVFTLILSSISVYYYKQQGLVRDIPELEMYVGVNSESPEEYTDRGFSFDKNFENNGRKNILVIGDSFGRDWINVLMESGVDSVLNISYHTEPDEVAVERIKQADYVFIANNTYMLDHYERLLPLALAKKFFRVGRKSFGLWIGNVYNNDRYGGSYYDQMLPEGANTIKTNTIESELYGDRFIDMMTPLKDKDGLISVFDDEKRLITQDGIHITRAGAKMYAQKINVWKYLE